MAGTDDALMAMLSEKIGLRAERLETSTLRERRPAVSQGAVANAEAALGFSLHPLLRRVYLEVCDGGLGPGYGSLPLMGAESLCSTYASFRAGPWPEKLLPVWDWGGQLGRAWILKGRSSRMTTWSGRH